MKTKDMFFSSGPSNYDGRCADCPYVDKMDNTCKETEGSVDYYVRSGRMNYSCPFSVK